MAQIETLLQANNNKATKGWGQRLLGMGKSKPSITSPPPQSQQLSQSQPQLQSQSQSQSQLQRSQSPQQQSQQQSQSQLPSQQLPSQQQPHQQPSLPQQLPAGNDKRIYAALTQVTIHPFPLLSACVRCNCLFLLLVYALFVCHPIGCASLSTLPFLLPLTLSTYSFLIFPSPTLLSLSLSVWRHCGG